jgi:hypothetical protein
MQVLYVHRDKAEDSVKFDIRCREVVSFTLRSFSLVERNDQVTGWVGPGAVLDEVVKRNNSASACS